MGRMTGMKTLDALFPGPRRWLFAAMFAEPARWWSLPELAGRAGVNPPTLRQHLDQLCDAGVFREKSEGGRPWFQPDPACPVYGELHAIVTKSMDQTRGAETILIVEDQEATAQITRIVLESWGYRVLEAHSAGEALDIAKNGADIQLMLSNVILPGMSGSQLADELLLRRPGLRVIFMSGSPGDQASHPDAAFLPKPFNPSSLSRAIRRELDRSPSGRPNVKA
jgi:CheY-like chemotaxis protein